MPDIDNSNRDSGSSRSLRAGLEHARKQLLDLGLRNNLLNYRLLKTRGIDTSTPVPDELFEAMVASDRTIRFEAIPPDDSSSDVDLAIDAPAPQRKASRRPSRATTLEIRMEAADLERRLLNTHDHARISLEEQGLNTLFLAFGMLEWFESTSSSNGRFAPLVLVPVELSRRDATSQFVMTFSGEEIGGNLSLAAKLQGEFGIELPAFDPETSTLSEYLSAVSTAVSGQNRWSVDPYRVVLGQFSFNKYLMYRDLDVEAWPEDIQPLAHPVLGGLLSPEGFSPSPSQYSEQQFLDDVVSDDDHPMVVDADSSQTLALLDAIDGRTMVIQGPPGTGKSQTITNLIALAIGQGKKVLFVAEKMAALEVVKRRLDQLDLGVACLELHGTKTRKRRVLDDLNTTLGLGEPYLGHDLDDQRRLGANRAWLNEYCAALGNPVGETGISAYEALGTVVKMKDTSPIDDWPSIDLGNVFEWTSEMLHRRTSLVTSLQLARRQVGDPARHPFFGVQLGTLSPIEMEKVRNGLQQARQALSRVTETDAAFWSRLRQSPKQSRAGISTAVATGKRAAGVDAQGQIRYADPDWLNRENEIESLLIDGRMSRELRNEHDAAIHEGTWQADLDEVVGIMQSWRGSPFRWLSLTYWRTRSRVQEYVTDQAPDDVWERVDLLRKVQEYQRICGEIDSQDELGFRMFGDAWNGRDSDWAHLRTLFTSATTLQRDVEKEGLNSNLLTILDEGADREELSKLSTRLGEEWLKAIDLIQEVCHRLKFDHRQYDPTSQPVDEWSVDDQAALIRRWLENVGHLNQWVAFQSAVTACLQEDMNDVARTAWSWGDAGDHLEELFWYRIHFHLLDHAWVTRPVLSQAGGASKEHWRREFCRLDEDQLRWNQALLARQHWEQLPRSGGGELRVLATEIQKKRRNLPIRTLMARAGNAIQAIKPVFMMSPLSVANFLPQGALHFDMVIFDEASQVEPVDAFGAILRGNQSIVVGDDRQLPPTDFFQRTLAEDEPDDDSLVSPGDVQSILNLFLAQRAPERMLRWHYRSQHESLIAVSNQEFYDNRLVVFPSPSRDSGGLGLRFNHLPDSTYDRGHSRTNLDEAQAVAHAVMEHAIETPELTLGVAAFSAAQAEAVRDQLELLRRQDSSAESFFNDHPAEPFFIKSLENVQGDERDVIFISVGYGRDTHGRITSNFGPINNEGGERRLNVLITRARRRCEVFSNITDEDIPATSASRGVQALRTFLHYARTGEFSAVSSAGSDVQSPFEEAVLTALEQAGYQVHTQVGSAGYFIDLAVVDAERPGRYLLAVECDGATFHSSRSSRDRDRLRQQVLERLGWRFHRIWSTDWFTDRDAEMKRLLQAIEEASVVRETEDPPVRSRPENGSLDRAEPELIVDPDNVTLPPYEFADPVIQMNGSNFDSISDGELGDALIEVVEVEGPIHEHLLARRIVRAAGLKRTGRRIRDRIFRAISTLSQHSFLNRHDNGFVWPKGMTEPPVRSRMLLDQAERKLELIAPEELDAIILDVVQRSFTIAPGEAARMVVRSLGMQRTGHVAVAILEQRVNALISDGRLVVDADGNLSVAST
jgi:very-short-patch-repair endonuclease